MSMFMNYKPRELIAFILFIVFLIVQFPIPEFVDSLVDNILGKLVILVGVVYMFMHCNPILAVLATLVAFDLIRRSADRTGSDALARFAPSEAKKMSQFTAFNQFPYTLEQEVVAKMVPAVSSGIMLTTPSYKPLLADQHGANLISKSD